MRMCRHGRRYRGPRAHIPQVGPSDVHLPFGNPVTVGLKGLTGTHTLLPLKWEEYSPRDPEEASRP